MCCPPPSCYNFTAGCAGCRVFRPLISSCYYNDGEAITRFVFELTSGEASALMTEFERRKAPTQAPPSRHSTANGARKPSAVPATKPAAASAAAPAGPDEAGSLRCVVSALHCMRSPARRSVVCK